MLMVLVLETPCNRHWHSKVVQLGLFRLSPLTVGLKWISQHGYRRPQGLLAVQVEHGVRPPALSRNPEVLDKTCCFFTGCLGVVVLLQT